MKTKLLLIMTLFASLNFLSAQTFTINNVNYQVSSGTNVDVIASPSATGNVVIPSTFDDGGTTYTVSRITTNAFNSNTNITSVVFPETLTFLGLSSFRYCTNLVSFEITNPSNLTTIATAVFNGCTSLVSANFTGVPADLSARIGLFVDCTSLKSFEMLGNTATTKIGNNFFNGCTSLESVAFSGCTNIVAFGQTAFANVDALKTLYLGNDNLVTTVAGELETFRDLDIEDPIVPIDLTGATLYLPSQTGVSNYSASAYWSEALDPTYGLFANISVGYPLSTDSKILESVNIYKTDDATLTISGLQTGNASVKIFNILGEQVLKQSFSVNGVENIALPALTSGIYIVNVENVDGRLNKKIYLE